jgi:hypothetical protein
MNRGRRECRALNAPAACVQMKKAHEHSHHGHTGNHPAFPAQWFYGLLRALPGDQACLTPSPALLLADLTPALGRQNHTTWPYVAGRVRLARCPVHRIPRSTSVTIAKRPSEEAGPNRYSADLPSPSSEILKIRNQQGPAGAGGDGRLRAGLADFSRRRGWQPQRGLEFKPGTTDFGFEFAWV